MESRVARERVSYHRRPEFVTENSSVGQASAPGKLRIIGGEWRSRRLPVPRLEGLRPTTDRIRETLFNWLAGEIHGRRCLDLFAGSGALGYN